MMVGIVAILLLASLAWSAVGALFSAVGSAGSALTSARTAPPTLAPAVAATPTVIAVVVPTPAPASPTLAPTAVPASTPTAVGPTPTAQVAARNPWILLPQPEPGSRVAVGAVTVEARGRGDSPITGIRLELDGAVLPVSFEQRSESTWRGFATTKVTPGEHAVRAVVTDADGRSGSFRWSFSAGS